jgi:hypothetical protein
MSGPNSLEAMRFKLINPEENEPRDPALAILKTLVRINALFTRPALTFSRHI